MPGPGTYTVMLTVTNAGGSNSTTRTNYITVNPPPPVAGFIGTPISGNLPLTVTFTDSSTNNPTSWLWNFGDGDTTNNSVKNPVHRYSGAGTYTVLLTATNAGGSNSTTKTNYITVNLPPRQNILFDDFETIFSASWIQTGSLTGIPVHPNSGLIVSASGERKVCDGQSPQPVIRISLYLFTWGHSPLKGRRLP